MIYFTTCGLYLDSITDLRAKIAAIDVIINALLAAVTTGAANEGIKEYSLNDGQVIIKEVYDSSQTTFNAIKSFESLKQYYISKINGRVFKLVHDKNFVRRY